MNSQTEVFDKMEADTDFAKLFCRKIQEFCLTGWVEPK